MLESQAFYLKGPHTHLLTDKLTCSEIHHWGRSLKGVRNIWAVTELSSFSMRAGEAAFSQTEVLPESIISLFSLLPSCAEVSGHHI